jgi:asparagine N-glycosylation enzyme membrane subunit Stt3
VSILLNTINTIWILGIFTFILSLFCGMGISMIVQYPTITFVSKIVFILLYTCAIILIILFGVLHESFDIIDIYILTDLSRILVLGLVSYIGCIVTIMRGR